MPCSAAGRAIAFSEIVGATAILPSIKYVITLDTDTQLPRDAARQLVGTMAHPLNRPTFDPARGIVVEGYSILQPRVGVSLPSARRSWFVRLFAGDAGIDPYTREVSDVYQDVFQEGSFIGKGIYDVDAFQQAMNGRFPENTILSHDLLEACHARSGLVSDVEFYEAHPSRYNVDMDRRHRWIRGDWQISQWLLPRVPGADARRIANPLSGLSRWKIFDNLRRSLVPVALLLLLLGNWLLVPELGAWGRCWSCPHHLSGLVVGRGQWVSPAAGFALGDAPAGCAGSWGRQLGQAFLTVTFLPYDAFISLDAIGRTLAALAGDAQTPPRMATFAIPREPRAPISPAFMPRCGSRRPVALATGFYLAVHPAQSAHGPADPGLWLAAPWIAWWISQPLESGRPDLTPDQLTFLRRTARKTWHYFETFVTAQENWLPPDNVQEMPAPDDRFANVAHQHGLGPAGQSGGPRFWIPCRWVD
jgi:cyclic beta-1,2-glucan synthetase